MGGTRDKKKPAIRIARYPRLPLTADGLTTADKDNENRNRIFGLRSDTTHAARL